MTKPQRRPRPANAYLPKEVQQPGPLGDRGRHGRALYSHAETGHRHPIKHHIDQRGPNHGLRMSSSSASPSSPSSPSSSSCQRGRKRVERVRQEECTTGHRGQGQDAVLTRRTKLSYPIPAPLRVKRRFPPQTGVFLDSI